MELLSQILGIGGISYGPPGPPPCMLVIIYTGAGAPPGYITYRGLAPPGAGSKVSGSLFPRAFAQEID